MITTSDVEVQEEEKGLTKGTQIHRDKHHS